MTDSPLTDTEKAELGAAAKAATPGPWYAADPSSGYGKKLCQVTDEDGFQEDAHREAWSVSSTPGYAGWETDSGCSGYGICEHDARFIALANPSTVLRLLAELAAVKRERDDLRERLYVADAEIRELE